MAQTSIDQQSNPLQDAALALASQGWAVFPLHSMSRKTGGCDCNDEACNNAAKHPWTRNGLKDAATDSRKITQWWRAWPRANVAVATGRPSGLLVVDIDPRHGGDEALDELQRRYGQLPVTRESLTGGGGRHLLYAIPDGVDPTKLRNKTNLAGLAGLDLRGDGGYIVAPPSLHASGALYEWVDPSAGISQAPKWLCDLASASAASQRTASAVAPVRMLPKRGDGVIGEYWLNRALQIAQEGNRHDRGVWLACQLRDDGIDVGTASARMREYAALVGGVTPYPEREALKTLYSVYATPARQPARNLNAQPFTTPAAPQPAQGDTQDSASAATQAKTEPEAEQEPARFRFLSVTDVKNLPAPTWLIDHVLPAGTLALVFGTFASGKSFLTLDYALCLATGTPWDTHEVKRGVVCYVAGEGLGGMGRRVRAWERHHGIEVTENLYFLGNPPQLLSQSDVDTLIAAIAGLPEAPALIVVDTLARSLAGGDENAAKDMGIAVGNAGRLVAATGATVILVHHKPKNGTGPRGSNALPSGADTMIEVTKDGQRVTVECPKQKDSQQFKPHTLKLAVVRFGDGPDDDSCVLTNGEPTINTAANDTNENGAALEPLTRSANAVYDLLHEAGKPLQWNVLRLRFDETTGMDKRTLSRALDHLERHHLATHAPDGWKLTDYGRNMYGSYEQLKQRHIDL